MRSEQDLNPCPPPPKTNVQNDAIHICLTCETSTIGEICWSCEQPATPINELDSKVSNVITQMSTPYIHYGEDGLK